MAGEMCTGVPRYLHVLCAGWDNTVSRSENREYLKTPGREYSTLVWGENKAASGGRLIGRLKEALKVGCRGAMYTDVVGVL